jgi:hypothetical protein
VKKLRLHLSEASGLVRDAKIANLTVKRAKHLTKIVICGKEILTPVFSLLKNNF